jgi:hypothetical protein
MLTLMNPQKKNPDRSTARSLQIRPPQWTVEVLTPP